MDDMDTREAIVRVGAGDESGLRWLMCRYRGQVYGTVSRMVKRHYGNRDIDDLFQKVWGRVQQGAAGFQWRSEASFRAWLNTIANRICLDFIEVQQHTIQLVDDPDTWKESVGQVPEPGPGPARELAMKNILEDMQQCVNGLPDRERTVIELFQGGATQREIAEVLGGAVGTAFTYLHRAFLTVRKCLISKGWTCQDLGLFQNER